MRHGDALRNSVEDLRAEKFPQLDSQLVEEVLSIELERVEDRDEARQQVLKAIWEHVTVIRESDQ